MALQIEGDHLCKVFYSENGKVFIRRVGSMLVQRSDGRVERLVGSNLPDSIALYVGGQSDGKGVLEIIERSHQSSTPSTQNVEELYMVASRRRLVSDRDMLFLVFGMLVATVLCLWVFTAWFELHDFRSRVVRSTPGYGYSPRPESRF